MRKSDPERSHGCACVRALRTALPLVAACSLSAAASTDFDELEAAGATVGDIHYEIRDIFDVDSKAENKSFFRLANRLHVNTRESTLASQLLIRPGDTFDKQKVLESERLLRSNEYLFDADIAATRVSDGVVDLTVTTRDNWTLFPELSFSRSGGENETIYGIEETNLLGTGVRMSVTREDDVDRSSTTVEYSDRNLGRSRVQLDLGWSDADDGDAHTVRVERPFFALDTRWAAGTTLSANDRVDRLYSDGSDVVRYRNDQRSASAYYGWSAGLRDGWVRRWSVGAVWDDNDFDTVAGDGLLEVAPADRELAYPFLALRVIQDEYVKARNVDQIARTEDLFTGTAFGVSLGWSDEAFGADRDALVFAADVSTSYGSPKDRLWRLRANVDGRVESGSLRNAELRVNGRYHLRQSDRRVLFGRLDVVAGHELDLDNPVVLGGETGLRGYPFRYRNGEVRAVLNIEQRYYTDYYPFRLFRVGGALFFDVGRVWGSDVTGRNDDDLLANLGIGLRLGSTRIGSNKTVHIDAAFPLDRDEGVDAVQISVEGRRSF